MNGHDPCITGASGEPSYYRMGPQWIAFQLPYKWLNSMVHDRYNYSQCGL